MFLKKFFVKSAPQIQPGENPLKTIKNWYQDRYDAIIVQRNILLIIVMLTMIVMVCSIIGVVILSGSKTFDPFVIQIDDKTGIAQVVAPVTRELLDSNESLTKYFIKKYLSARETYNAADFDVLAKKTIRLLSSSNIYWGYLSYINNPDTNPVTKYGSKGITTSLQIKSWSLIDAKKYLIRFSIKENNSQASYNKIAVVEFDYVPMKLNPDEMDINPVGFQVTNYRVDDDNS